VIVCDLCGRARECLQKEIDAREYDICAECWAPLAEKLLGKGRAKKETILLPQPRVVKEREGEEPKPRRGEPPKIWCRTGTPYVRHSDAPML